MTVINEQALLKAKIIFLRQKQAKDCMALKQQYNETIECLKPINLIKSASLEFISIPNLKSNLINGAIGITATYLTKNVLNENSTNPVKRILGKVLKLALDNFAKNKHPF